jgi:aromatic ring-opening dioxygenase catalytic subunit (LigB family)
MTTTPSSPASTQLPTFFIPHGAGPCFFMDWTRGPADTWDKTAAFLKGLIDSLDQKPRGIVLVSGHWEMPQFSVTAAAKPELIFDYGGFPPHTYQLRHDAPGDPVLADHVRALLSEAGIESLSDPVRGWDHGVFIPMKLIDPDAAIPIVQLSLRRGLDPAAHMAVGEALAPLRREGILLIGSGMSFHNMRGYGDARFGPVSDQFDDWLTTTLESAASDRGDQLKQWAAAPGGRLSHPREEHLAPLFVVAGAAPGEPGRKVFSDRVLETTISAYRFG